MTIQDDIKKRRTFAIISHPDAGKTTITEQLLYFGGEIREAGTVKGKKTVNFAKSDWMDIEKQRGISVTSSVMQFDYAGKRVNILDTRGTRTSLRYLPYTYGRRCRSHGWTLPKVSKHKRKTFEVVKHRNIPVFTFINKLDRDGREPLDLWKNWKKYLVLQTINELANWYGKSFEGLYDLYNKRLELYKGDERFAALEDGDKLFANNPFYQQVLEMLSC